MPDAAVRDRGVGAVEVFERARPSGGRVGARGFRVGTPAPWRRRAPVDPAVRSVLREPAGDGGADVLVDVLGLLVLPQPVVAGKLRHGTVWINDFHPYLPQAEWGGMKQSGVGRELGHDGLGEDQETKHVYQTVRPAVTGWFAQH